MIGLSKLAKVAHNSLNSAVTRVNAISSEVHPRRIPWSTYVAVGLLAPLGFALWVKESFQWSEGELRLLMKLKFAAEEQNLADIEAEYGDDACLRRHLERIRVLLERAHALEQSSHSPCGRLFRQVRIMRLLRAKHQAQRAGEQLHRIWQLYM